MMVVNPKACLNPEQFLAHPFVLITAVPIIKLFAWGDLWMQMLRYMAGELFRCPRWSQRFAGHSQTQVRDQHFCSDAE